MNQTKKSGKMRIYIIGFMGAGKSRFAKNLASSLAYEFLDLDLEIERSEHKWISEIFATKGEDYFRKAEQNALKNTLEKSDVVIACGGGTPVFFDNMEFMNKNGKTIYLKPDNQIIIDRLNINSRKRPLLKQIRPEEMADYVNKLLKERNLFYRKAHFVIDPQRTQLEQVSKMLIQTS
ncbi:MAG: shikimate kinase [Bacteroidetes bacterium]|nr:shikimate kinase [Bacteroidota bacterium]